MTCCPLGWSGGAEVAPGESLPDVLFKMRRARRHVAVVQRSPDGADGPAEILGLVTMEDLLEAIVGDIRDESDRVGSREGTVGDVSAANGSGPMTGSDT
ncbi:MAG: CBS domain-containing protein [Microthrixaceae bacterium]